MKILVTLLILAILALAWVMYDKPEPSSPRSTLGENYKDWELERWRIKVEQHLWREERRCLLEGC